MTIGNARAALPRGVKAAEAPPCGVCGEHEILPGESGRSWACFFMIYFSCLSGILRLSAWGRVC
jgi:hypothetical protein